MIPVLSRAQIRAFDEYAIAQRKIPSLLLMENAGRGAADVIERVCAAQLERPLIVCGVGNNGGDGFVVARRLWTRGRRSEVFLVGSPEKLSSDARSNYDAFCGVGGAVSELVESESGSFDAALARATLVVDALLGTGLDREVTGRLKQVIERINAADARRVALDIPSGLHADTGVILGAAIRADLTVTFAHWKRGLLTTQGAERAGHVEVVDIGVPPDFVEAVGVSAHALETSDVARVISPRSITTHKGSAGRVVVIAGSAGKIGAALLVARGALRCGAGLVTIATSPDAADALDSRVLEEMTYRIDPDDPRRSLDALLSADDVVVIGPGLGLGDDARTVVEHVVSSHPAAVVVDADALTHFAGRAEYFANAKGARVLTPHPGEMGRLLGTSSADVERDRFAAVSSAAAKTCAVVLLKGPRTLISAADRTPVVNRSGTPALATPGSGDVLAGMVGAFVRTMPEPFIAAYAAAHVHGLCAEAWSRRDGGDRGLLAHEIADAAPAVIAGLARTR